MSRQKKAADRITMSNLNLVPVVEISPTDFEIKKLPSPKGTVKENPKGWDVYWRTSLGQSGISDLDPYEEGSWLVPVRQLLSNLDSFKLVLRKKLEDQASSDLDPEEFYSLEGGYVMELNGRAVVYPQCCGALENLKEWERFAKSESKEEKELWIGHPWLMAKSLNLEKLHLRKTAEYGEPEEPETVVIDKEKLLLATEHAQMQLSELVCTLKDLLPQVLEVDVSSDLLEKISTVMVYGHEDA